MVSDFLAGEIPKWNRRAIRSLYWAFGILPVHLSYHYVSEFADPFGYAINVYVIRTPEVFEIVPKTVKVTARKNLAQVSKVLTQIVTGKEFGDDQPIYIPINDFVREASGRMTAWLLEGKPLRSNTTRSFANDAIVADVPDAESYFYAHEFLDVTVQPKPIYISPNEVYTMHGLLLQHLKFLVGLVILLLGLVFISLPRPLKTTTRYE